MLEQRPTDVFGERPIDGAPLLPGNGDGELFSGNSLTAHRHYEAGRAIIMTVTREIKDEVELEALKSKREEEARRQTQETQDRIWAATQRVSEVMRLEDEERRRRSAEV